MKYTVFYDETTKQYKITSVKRESLPWIYTPIMTLGNHREAQALTNMFNETMKVLRKKGL
nr:MAG TPA: hypothetical protein [Caudoviricetes sp.]